MSQERRRELTPPEVISYLVWATMQQYQKPTFKQCGIPCGEVHKNEAVLNRRK